MKKDELRNCAECWNMLSYCVWCGNFQKASHISETLESIKSKSKVTYYLGRLLRFFFI
mgnify:CR=1 FL=1